MTPDSGYQRSVRRLRVSCWFLAAALFALALWCAQSLPFAAALATILSIMALRIADEVREEIEGWTPRVDVAPGVIRYGDITDRRPLHWQKVEPDEDGFVWVGGHVIARVRQDPS